MIDQVEKARRYDVWQAWTEGKDIASRPVRFPERPWLIFSCRENPGPTWDWDRFEYRMADEVRRSGEPHQQMKGK